MTAFEENKAEESKTKDLPPVADPVSETKPKRKPIERKPRAKKEKTETESVPDALHEALPEALPEPLPITEAEPKKKSARKTKPKAITTTPVEIDPVVSVMC